MFTRPARAASGVVPVELLKQHRAHLFSSAPVFLSETDLAAMETIVQAIEATAQLTAFQDAALAWAPEIAKVDLGPRGAFMGYDFQGHDAPQFGAPDHAGHLGDRNASAFRCRGHMETPCSLPKIGRGWRPRQV